MNLPASAIEFLDAFHGAFSSRADWEKRLPLVHCYCFQRKDESHTGKANTLQMHVRCYVCVTSMTFAGATALCLILSF